MLYHIYELDSGREICYNVESSNNKLKLSEIYKLCQILYNGKPLRYDKPFYKNIVEYGIKLDFESPWSMNIKSILINCGITTIRRIERTTRLLKIYWTNNILDPVLETIYNNPIESFTTTNHTETCYTIDYNKIQKYNDYFKLGMDKDDINYYKNLYENILKRYPTNVELFDLAQSNSEHSRHWFFNGLLKKDGEYLPQTLFDMVKSTLIKCNSIIAFSDNSSAIKGHIVKSLVLENNIYKMNTTLQHLTLTAETHNFPTGIAPFPGAATGIGGRIRDNQAVGRGGKIIASSAGYCVGNLFLNNVTTSWEERKDYHKKVNVKASRILIEASNGASDYGNKIGEPIILGFTRSFGMQISKSENIEWLKPIMFTGGIGQIYDMHKYKKTPETGMRIIRLGGPAYRIGIGGGAASSRVHDNKNNKQDMTAVQRGDPEMENKLNKVIRACIELGLDNPIQSIHDQGAGGLANVTKEIVEPTGGQIDIRKVTQGTANMSVLDIWTSEFQESNTCLIKEKDLHVIETICKRENLPLDNIGYITSTGKMQVYDELFNKLSVDLDLKHVLSEIPQKEYNLVKVNKSLPPLSNINISIYSSICDVFRLVSVGSKQFLTNKVDRSVTGLIAQQQCIGIKHLPLSDYALVAQSHYELAGGVTAIGEQPIKGLINPKSMAHMAIGELLTNIMWVKIPSIKHIKCSGNWMWPLKHEGEKYALYEACQAMCDMMKEIGISIDGGKDSLSMSTKIGDDEYVKSPRSLVLSGYADCPDITNRVTADFKQAGNNIIFIDLGCGKNRMDGSSFAHINKNLGNEPPILNRNDIHQVKKLFDIIQTCIDNKYIVAGHDKSDGGLITTLVEMCLSTPFGCDINLNNIYTNPTKNEIFKILFNEELGVVIEVPNDFLSLVMKLLTDFSCYFLGEVNYSIIPRMFIKLNNWNVHEYPILDFLKEWQCTSFGLENLQCNIENVIEEQQYFKMNKMPCYKITDTDIDKFIHSDNSCKLYKVAIIREEGSNGEREMAAAFTYAGFTAYDINSYDLMNCPNLLDDFNGIVFVGGFSFSDVLGAGNGWYNVIKFNKNIREAIDKFYLRNDTFSLGICNGCQLMSYFSVFKNVNLLENTSQRFESRFSNVTIRKTNSIMFKDLEGSQLGVWVAHKEGRFNNIGDSQIALQYTDNGNATMDYPINPNGSINGTAGICDITGRHLIMMPHPERCFLNWQVPYVPNEWKHNKYYPWMRMFKNAYNWVDENLSADSTI